MARHALPVLPAREHIAEVLADLDPLFCMVFPALVVALLIVCSR